MGDRQIWAVNKYAYTNGHTITNLAFWPLEVGMVREAASPIAKYTDGDPTMAQLFTRNGNPLNIWVSLQVPTRKTFTEMIEVIANIPAKLMQGTWGEDFAIRNGCRRTYRRPFEETKLCRHGVIPMDRGLLQGRRIARHRKVHDREDTTRWRRILGRRTTSKCPTQRVFCGG